MDYTQLMYVGAAIAILVGLAGTLLPILPGLPLVFAGMVLAAWAGDFQRVGWVSLVVLGLLTIASVVVDILATVYGAKRVGASDKAMWGSVAGTLVGLFFGPLGMLAGPFLGAQAGEYWHGREWKQATRVGLGTWIGIAVGLVIKVIIALVMLVWFLVDIAA